MKRIRKSWWILLVALMFCLLISTNTWARQKEGQKKAVILIANALTWSDIEQADTPFIKSLVRNHASADMSPRTIGRTTSFLKACSSLGAGNRVDSSRSSINVRDAGDLVEGEIAGEEYFRRTGIKPSLDSVVNLDIAVQIEDNKDSAYGAVPGLLGQVLHEHSLKTCIIGNSDATYSGNKELFHREAAAVVMDEKGLIDFGLVGKGILQHDGQAPFGVRTDQRKVIECFKRFYPRSDVIVIDYGDTARLDMFKQFSTEDNWLRMKERVLGQFDDFVQDLYTKIDQKNTVFMIVSPCTSMDLSQPQQLNIMIVAGSGFRSGLLFSADTQRPGLVTNIDLAPTVLDRLGLEVPSDMSGMPMMVSPAGIEERISFLNRLNTKSLFMDENQSVVIVFYIFFQVVVFGLAIAFLINRLKKDLHLLVIYLILIVMSVPLSLYLSSMLVEAGLGLELFFPVALIFLIILPLIATMLRRFDRFLPVIFLSGCTTLWLIIDLLFLDGLTNINTVGFGYSPIIAGRFYGMGNEAMSVFIICSLLATVLIWERFTRPAKATHLVLVLLFLGFTFIIGFPKIGANTGGTITAVVSYSVVVWQMFTRKIKASQVIAILVCVMFILSLFIAADLMRPQKLRTHMGRTVELIGQEGSSAVAKIVQRKVATNWRILRNSWWSILVLFIIAVLVFLSYYPVGSFEALGDQHPKVMMGLKGALIGSIVGFLSNDSGVAIPALMLSFVVSVILYLLLMDFPMLTFRSITKSGKAGRR